MMWITQKTLETIIDETRGLKATLATTQALLDLEKHHLTAVMTTLDWLRVRVTQLEQERAQLLFNYTGVKVPTPRIEREGEVAAATHPAHFNDIGDAEAARLGIGWDEAGNVTYMQSDK